MEPTHTDDEVTEKLQDLFRIGTANLRAALPAILGLEPPPPAPPSFGSICRDWLSAIRAAPAELVNGSSRLTSPPDASFALPSSVEGEGDRVVPECSEDGIEAWSDHVALGATDTAAGSTLPHSVVHVLPVGPLSLKSVPAAVLKVATPEPGCDEGALLPSNDDVHTEASPDGSLGGGIEAVTLDASRFWRLWRRHEPGYLRACAQRRCVAPGGATFWLAKSRLDGGDSPRHCRHGQSLGLGKHPIPRGQRGCRGQHAVAGFGAQPLLQASGPPFAAPRSSGAAACSIAGCRPRAA